MIAWVFNKNGDVFLEVEYYELDIFEIPEMERVAVYIDSIGWQLPSSYQFVDFETVLKHLDLTPEEELVFRMKWGTKPGNFLPTRFVATR